MGYTNFWAQLYMSVVREDTGGCAHWRDRGGCRDEGNAKIWSVVTTPNWNIQKILFSSCQPRTSYLDLGKICTTSAGISHFGKTINNAFSSAEFFCKLYFASLAALLRNAFVHSAWVVTNLLIPANFWTHFAINFNLWVNTSPISQNQRASNDENMNSLFENHKQVVATWQCFCQGCSSWSKAPNNITLPILATANTVSVVEGAPFHENCREKKLLVPIQIHWVEKLKVPYKWWILSWWHIYL